jgi:hypothetical protein
MFQSFYTLFYVILEETTPSNFKQIKVEKERKVEYLVKAGVDVLGL